MPSINAQLLRILVCPVPECRAKLELRDDCLVCSACGRRYRIEERWPVLIPEEAEPPEEADA
ncbi:MAG: Trm112 family protein [Phycisphaerae bacterium]